MKGKSWLWLALFAGCVAGFYFLIQKPAVKTPKDADPTPVTSHVHDQVDANQTKDSPQARRGRRGSAQFTPFRVPGNFVGRFNENDTEPLAHGATPKYPREQHGHVSPTGPRPSVSGATPFRYGLSSRDAAGGSRLRPQSGLPCSTVCSTE